ncbi:MAG: FAD synthetase family protein, partial [Erysipelotrichales bacterium]
MDIVHIRFNQLNSIMDEHVAAIGNFDGLHAGHQKVIERSKKLALKHKMKLGLLSFDITPRQVVNNIDNYYVLKSLDQKNKMLEDLGVDTLFLIHFNHEIKNMSPIDFINNVIINNNIKYLVCGFDFRFGKDKAGDTDLLKKQSKFETVVLDKVEFDNKKIGSTAIHEYLSHGEIEKANQL